MYSHSLWQLLQKGAAKRNFCFFTTHDPWTSVFYPSSTSSSCVLLLFVISASASNMAKIEEMERLLREAQAEKQRLLEHRVKEPSCTRTTRLILITVVNAAVRLRRSGRWRCVGRLWRRSGGGERSWRSAFRRRRAGGRDLWKGR